MHQKKIDKRYDKKFKKVLSKKIFLAKIMKECLKEFKDIEIKDIVEHYIENHIQVNEKVVHDTIAGSKTEIIEDGKTTTFDINFYARLPKSNERISIVINVEVQVDFDPGYHMMNRAHYYNARNISSQFNVFFSESNYDGLRKVVSIWLLFGPPKYMSDGINSYTMVEKHLHGNVQEKSENIEKNQIVMVYLGQESKNELIQLLNSLCDGSIDVDQLKKDLEIKHNYRLDSETESEVRTMGNVGEYMRKKATREGMAKGIIEGRIEGRIQGKIAGKIEGKIEGKEEAILESLKNLMSNLNMTLKSAMEALGLSEEDQKKYELLMKNKK